MDAYKIGVSIILNNGISQGLTAITQQLLGMNSAVTSLNSGIGRLGLAVGGVAAIFAGEKIFKGMGILAEHGAEVNHQMELMKIAGMTNSEIQESLAQSMKTTGAVMTTTLSENLAHIRELRYAFGDTEKAMSHLDMVAKANSILNAVKGGGRDQVWELVKSLEGKGLTFDEKEFSSYINTMTKVTEGSGGKVTPQQFMSTFKYGRTATLGWDEGFVGGALPRLIQSMAQGNAGGGGGAGGPGNALMSAFGKIVQGQMSKTAAAEFNRMGLVPGGVQHIEGSSESQVGAITGRDQFMANPYEWVQKTLMPALANKGITKDNDIIAEISKMIPVRTAAQVITEMALQGRFHEGANSPFEKDIAIQKNAMDLSMSFPELMKNDYPTVMKAFHQQFESLLQVLGSPLVAPGGPVLTTMAAITSAINSMAQFAGAHPEGLKIAMEILGSGALALITGGIVALGSAVMGIAGVPAILTALAVAIGSFLFLADRPKDMASNAERNKSEGSGPPQTKLGEIAAWIATADRESSAAMGALVSNFTAKVKQWGPEIAREIGEALAFAGRFAAGAATEAFRGIGTVVVDGLKTEAAFAITAVTGAFSSLGSSIVSSLNSAAQAAITAIPGIFSGIGAAIINAIKSAIGGIGGALGIDPAGKGSSPGKTGAPYKPTSYDGVPPPTSRGAGMQHASIIMDGEKVGRLVTKRIVDSASGPLQGAVHFDSTRFALRNDTSYIG